MGWIHLLLNLAALILLVGWVVSTSQPAPSRPRPRWRHPALWGALAILLIRPFFYNQLGSAIGWHAGLDFGPIVITFRSDHLNRMFLFSFLSLAVWLLVTWAWIGLARCLLRGAPVHPGEKWLEGVLGPIYRMPPGWSVWLPLVIAVGSWMALRPFFQWMELLPAQMNPGSPWREALLVGGGFILIFEGLILGWLFLGLLQSYVYFGEHPVWALVQTGYQRLLRLSGLGKLDFGKIAFGPMIGMVLVWWGCEWGHFMITWLYQHWATQ